MGEELWGSEAGNDFYGCSNASAEFEGEEISTFLVSVSVAYGSMF
jgi:hypothetical protein